MCYRSHLSSLNIDKTGVTLSSGKTEDKIHNPKHYSIHGLSPIEAFTKGLMSEEETRGFLKGNVIKYIVRYNHKNGLEDLYKAQEYINLLILFESQINKGF